MRAYCPGLQYILFQSCPGLGFKRRASERKPALFLDLHVRKHQTSQPPPKYRPSTQQNLIKALFWPLSTSLAYNLLPVLYRAAYSAPFPAILPLAYPSATTISQSFLVPAATPVLVTPIQTNLTPNILPIREYSSQQQRGHVPHINQESFNDLALQRGKTKRRK